MSLTEISKYIALILRHKPEEIGITRERFRSSFLRAQHARRRFTILDIAVRTGNLDKWIDEIFARKEI